MPAVEVASLNNNPQLMEYMSSTYETNFVAFIIKQFRVNYN